MGKNVPFSILPLPAMKRIASPFIGIGHKLAKSFPYLELQLKQAEFDADAEEYTAIMAFNFVLYAIFFAGTSSVLLQQYNTLY